MEIVWQFKQVKEKKLSWNEAVVSGGAGPCALVVSHCCLDWQIKLLHPPSNSMPEKTKFPKSNFAVMSSYFIHMGDNGGSAGSCETCNERRTLWTLLAAPIISRAGCSAEFRLKFAFRQKGLLSWIIQCTTECSRSRVPDACEFCMKARRDVWTHNSHLAAL